MSYCRFSSMSGRCEIYLYYGYNGYSLSVAANRTVTELPDIAEIDIEGYLVRQQLLKHNPDLVKHVPIELPYAGKSFSFDDKESCIAMLKELKALGYIMPDWLISELEQEQAIDVATLNGVNDE